VKPPKDSLSILKAKTSEQTSDICGIYKDVINYTNWNFGTHKNRYVLGCIEIYIAKVNIDRCKAMHGI
jgi:hypothetical protein